MALIIRDSFDPYTIATDAGLNYWDVVSTDASLVPPASTRFGVGQGLVAASNSGATIILGKTHGVTSSTLFFSFAFFPNFGLTDTTTTHGFRIYDGSTIQCSFFFRRDGSITFHRAGASGSLLLGTYSAAFAGSTWTHFQVKIVMGTGTSGEFHVRKNGNTSDDYTLTGVNNSASGVAQATRHDLLKDSNGLQTWYDDLAVHDSSGSAPWNDWVGDMRAVQVMPNSDSAVQFTQGQATLSEGNTTTGSTRSLTTNLQVSLLQFTPKHSGALANLIAQFNAAATGNINLAIFDSTGAGGGPGSVLTNGTCTPVTNPVINANTFTFPTPPTVVANTTYWLMAISNVAVTFKSTSGNVQQYTQTKTYSAGAFDSPMTLTSASLTPVAVTATITIANNYQLVQELKEDGATSYVFSSTVNHVDLYGNPGLTFTPSSILGVSVRGFVAKSDAGARSGALTLKSGGTTNVGPTLALPTSFQNITMVQDTDPNTAAAWTPSGLASATFGAKLIS